MLKITLFRCLSAGMVLSANVAFAADTPIVNVAADTPPADVSDKGFSFFMGLGGSTVRYQETTRAYPIKSEVYANNVILNSGALYALNQDYLFSIENQATFYPGSATESWTATSPFTSGVYSYNSGLLQQNNFSLSQSNTALNLHKKIADGWFVMGGPSFGSNSFKRNAFVAVSGVAISNSTVEESSSEILANIGIGLESEQLLNRSNHYSLNLTVGIPIWRRLQNTDVPSVIFTSTQGYDIALAGRYSWAIRKDMQIGLWGRLSKSFRGSQTIGTAELPDSELDAASYGLEILWKL